MLVFIQTPQKAYTPNEEDPLLVIFRKKGDVGEFVSGKSCRRHRIDLIKETIAEVELRVSGITGNEREALLVIEEKHFEATPDDPLLAVLGISDLDTTQALTDLIKTTLGKHLTHMRASNGGLTLSGFGLDRETDLLQAQKIGRSHIYYIPPKPFDRPALPCKNGVIGVTTRDQNGRATVVPLGGSNPVKGLKGVKTGKRRPHEVKKGERAHSRLSGSKKV